MKFFTKVFVVNLEKAESRRQYISDHLSKMGIPFVITKAVNGYELSEEELNKEYSAQKTFDLHGRYLGKGEVGCSLSHRNIYREIIADELKESIILEDDVELDPDFKNHVEVAIKNAGQEWDVIFLGQHIFKSRVRSVSVSFWNRSRISQKHIMGDPVEMISGTYGYIVSLAGAKKLLKMTDPIVSPADYYTGDFKKLKIKVIVPAVVHIAPQYSDDSHIAEERKHLIVNRVINYTNFEKFKMVIRKVQKTLRLRKTYRFVRNHTSLFIKKIS